MCSARHLHLLAAVVALALRAGAMRCSVEDDGPAEPKRRAVAEADSATPARAAPSKAVTWGADMEEPSVLRQVSRTPHGTVVGQEGRLNPDFARDHAAHRLARSFGRVPAWISQVLPASVVSDDVLEPVPFQCTRASAREFAGTVADHIVEFTEASVAGIAERFSDIRADCPKRCACLHDFVASNGSTSSSCTQASQRKFAMWQARRPEALRSLSDHCEARCACLGLVQAALAERQRLEEPPRAFALALLRTGPAAAMRVLDAWALQGEKGAASDFAGAVAREMGPHTRLATDVLAVWVRSQGDRALQMTVGIYRSLIFEEVREAMYACEDYHVGVPCILRAWPRPGPLKCMEEMMILSSQAMARLMRATSADIYAQLGQFCQGEQTVTAEP